MVRRTIVTRQTTPVHAQPHRQILNRHVMNDHVIRPLHERRVNRQKRLHPLRRHPARKQRRMLLRNPHIKVPLRNLLLKNRKPRPTRHRSRDRHHLLVHLRKIRHRPRKNLRIRRQRRARHLTRLDVVLAQPMELARIIQRRLVPTPLLRQDMQNHRLILRLQKLKRLGQEAHIMPVNRPVIPEPELLKKHTPRRRRATLRQQQSLRTLLHLPRKPPRLLAQHKLHKMRRLLMQVRIT